MRETMEERTVIQVVGQIMVYNNEFKQWSPAGTSSGLSTVRLLHLIANNTFKIHGQKINENREIVLDSEVTLHTKFNQANDCFIQWRDTKNVCWGINFRRGSQEGENFLGSVVKVIEMLKHVNEQRLMQHQRDIQQQQQIPPQPSTSMPQQQQQQHLVHHQVNPMMHQQQQPPPQMMAQQMQILQQAPQMQASVQQPKIQQPPPMMQLQQAAAQQMHLQQQQIMQQQHYQQAQTQGVPVQAQHQNQTQFQQSTQPPPVSNIPSPPPPPPAPPAPPAPSMNNSKINGFGANASQHSPVGNANNSINSNNANRNGGSPNQSLANELAKAGNQLRKVSLSRSDSDREPECNNNTISNAKTTRANSLAVNLMDDLKGRLASRREKIDQLDPDSASNNNGISNNGNTNGDNKIQESWLADLIRKEISKEITKMKAEIIDAIKTELRQR